MDASCKDCTYVIGLRTDVTDLKTDVKGLDGRLKTIEIADATKDEKIDHIADAVADIQASLKGINRSAWKILIGVISGVAIGVITAILLGR